MHDSKSHIDEIATKVIIDISGKIYNQTVQAFHQSQVSILCWWLQNPSRCRV
jgi:nicotinate-nucleotide pyrophosphorylase